jgi:hypothetical protein
MSSGDQFSEHEALEMADRVEAAMYVWRRKATTTHVVSKWESITELNADGPGQEPLVVGLGVCSCASNRGFQACHRQPWTQARSGTTRYCND